VSVVLSGEILTERNRPGVVSWLKGATSVLHEKRTRYFADIGL